MATTNTETPNPVPELVKRLLDGGDDVEQVMVELDTAIEKYGMKHVNLPLSAITPFISYTDPTIAQAATRILGACMSSVPLSYLLQNYNPYLNQGLGSPLQSVQLLTMDQFLRAKDDPEAAALLAQSPLLVEVVKCLGKEDTSVGTRALTVLLAVATHPDGRAALISGPLRTSLQAMFTKSSVVAMRVLELFVHIEAQYPDAAVEEILIPFITLATDYKTDLLQALSALEVLNDLVRVEHGFVFLKERGVLSQIFSVLGVSRDSLEAMLLPAVYSMIQALSRLTFVDLVGLNSEFNIMQSLEADIQNPDTTIHTPAVVTVAAVGSTAVGLQLILGTGIPRILVADCFSTDLARQSDAMRTTATIIDGTGDSEAFFADFESTFLPRLLTVAKTPFPEQRLASLSIMLALASHLWGKTLLVKLAGFLEYVLDRRTETSHAGKMAKFTLVERILQEPRPQLETQDYVNMRAFVVEGAFYVQAEAVVQVDMESS